MKRRALPRFVSSFLDRHGKERFRFRRKGYATYYFRAALGSEAFLAEYRACLDGVQAPAIEAGADRIATGSFNALIAAYYRSPEWLSPTDATRENRRRVIERFRDEYGKCLVKDLLPRHVMDILGRKAGTPNAANMLRKQLRRLMRFAVQSGYRPDNPVEATTPYKIKTDGYHTWTEEEIKRFEARHPLGSKARLALALMLWTGQRRGDVIQLGRQHLSDGRLRFKQAKTGTQLSLPVLPPLKAAIDAMPADNMAFLVTAYGKPFTSAGFGNWFRSRWDEAGLKPCTAHGLRKAAARRFAEAGCSNQEIKSWTGHRGDSEVALYTRAADQKALSDRAGSRLMRSQMANPKTRLAKSSNKPLKGK